MDINKTIKSLQEKLYTVKLFDTAKEAADYLDSKIDGKVVTPSLEGSILPGITRRSTIELLKSWNIPVEERKISIDELITAYNENKLEEAFGTGTAAVISPIGEFNYQNKIMVVNNNQIGELSQKLYDTLTGIQWGKLKDNFGWVKKLDF